MKKLNKTDQVKKKSRKRKLTTEIVLKEIGALADEIGISVWAVGGFVRDKLLDRTVTDIDFAVVGDGPDFARQVAKRLGTKTVVVFERFGTAMVHVGNFKLEFVGTRKEEYLPDSRKPIVTESSLDDDLLRRDFTINAIAMGLNQKNFGKLYDPLGGREDLEKKIIRTPLAPDVTFKDDPLRILRAIRFASRFDFEIEEKTFAALKNNVDRLKIISQERITEELMKMLEHDKPSLSFLLMDEVGVLESVLPEISVMKGVEQRAGYHHKDVFKHTLMVVDNVAAVSDKIELRLTALFHDVGKPVTKKFIDGIGWTFHGHEEIGARMLGRICRRLKLSNQITKYVQKLTRLHLRPISLAEEGVTDSAIRRLIVQAGDDLNDLITLCRADITSQNPQRVKRHLQNFDHVVQRIAEVEEKDRMRAFQSPVRGEEIMEVCALKPGPKVGKLKKMIEEAILEGEIPNEHDAALEFLLGIKDDVINESVK